MANVIYLFITIKRYDALYYILLYFIIIIQITYSYCIINYNIPIKNQLI